MCCRDSFGTPSLDPGSIRPSANGRDGLGALESTLADHFRFLEGKRTKEPSLQEGASMIANCRIIELPKIFEPRGNLTFIEGKQHLPFDIRRVYYLYDVPGGSERGGHAHKQLHQFIIAMSGSFDVVLSDGKEKRVFHLNRSYYGLYLSSMIWRELNNFSSGSVCLVLASEHYDEADYYRDYDQYCSAMGFQR